MKEEKSFSERFSEFRKAVSEMDWTADGVNTNQGWTFLSESKIKGQLSPALAKYGIGWVVSYSDLKVLDAIGSMKQHYVVTIHVRIFDLEGIVTEPIEFEAYGEGADSGDKGVSKAQTNALKNVIANNFLLSSFSVEAENAIESRTSARAEGGNEREALKTEAKEKIIAQQKAQPTTAPATPTKINQIQLNAMEKIMNKISVADQSMLVPFGGKEEIETAYRETLASGNPQQAAAFIQKYKVV